MTLARGSVYLAVGTEATDRVSDLSDALDDSPVSVEAVADRAAVRDRLADGTVRAVVVGDGEDDGIDVFEALRAVDDAVPVVVLAADPDPDRVETALMAGVTDYLPADVDAELLAARLEAYAKRWPTDWRTATAQWDDISSGISHDAKNPLNVVMGRLDLMEVGEPHEEPLRRSVDRVESFLTDLSRIGSVGRPVTDPEDVSLADVARDAWSAADRGGATLEVATEGTVDADPDRLRLLFERLFDNAVDHGGEAVTVTVGETDVGFYVADDGPGIPDDEREDVFELGYGTTRNGEGYGLFFARVIARAHGWTVVAGESADGGARIDVSVSA
ncbi:sensor histidine kinase [Haloarcula salina]|uniref:histidine kinase n=1 Tax=Haloarcula salina TaxID=1429914 RepID=A0AA41FYK2_9EURY|nr:ATP-binding protein [Haloarcula salina]MBV0901160.1 hybrid sensor histidine kinase/response regulator [Haloarcula salina]